MMGRDLNENPADRKKAVKRIKQCRMIFTTSIGAGLGLLRDEEFGTVIIDEASQQVEPQSLVPLTKGCSKCVLVGDHVQLSATVHPHAQALGHDVSLFERLYQQSPRGTLVEKAMLDTQYRMHASICAFSSQEFYEGRLKTAVSEVDRPLLPASFPWPSGQPEKLARMFFIQCNAPEDIGRRSKSNPGQAALAAKICKMLLPPERNTEAPSIAVLAPYAKQVEQLRASLPHVVSINSIDGFQGREADIVLFITTRCNVNGDVGFLKDMRRLNVVLTRAKSACIVIGDVSTLTSNLRADEPTTRIWQRLINRCTTLNLD